MANFKILRNLIMKHRYQLILTYSLFSLEMLGSLLRFYFFGEAINELIKGSYRGLIILTLVHLAYLIIGTVRHMFDTRTYSAIYTSMVTGIVSRKYRTPDVSKLTAHSTLAREFVDFLEHDLVYVIEAAYNIFGSLIILFFYDKVIVSICLVMMVPVVLISRVYGKKMMRLNKSKNDELEKQVDIISAGNPVHIHRHYTNLRKWQIGISDKEAWNFGFMELMVLLVITISLIASKSLHSATIMAGSLFAVYSYILKFAAGLDTIPYTMERLSSLSDITRRLESESVNVLVEKDIDVEIAAIFLAKEEDVM
ncbi:ABC transporter six-transmembrane domain-containing protein [Ferruginibacter paludis]|uniref:ABC transporter six-transmembrane domain-containing protein n=1 Tax=Ferruginibacter paludis TaxID=1310417 RepID=UPI0025B57008|nr:ABC transporter six-transmembrane domain-containing protein [Ferruginibacter paludis]MDN3654925.1 ABC transporter six-transmembrane domain-containing protein [Ferruginibacter paludis]